MQYQTHDLSHAMTRTTEVCKGHSRIAARRAEIGLARTQCDAMKNITQQEIKCALSWAHQHDSHCDRCRLDGWMDGWSGDQRRGVSGERSENTGKLRSRCVQHDE
jgi:hypothetical protein